MQCVAAGDEIVITRRGRRYARLGPPDPQLAPEDAAPDPGGTGLPGQPPRLNLISSSR
jgi:antitoxin (DNA-binding transcriptional repressor) of toxin-antitoxin stability system